MTDTSQTQVARVRETAYGVTPNSPAFKKLRTTSVLELTPNNTFVMSDEIRPDRNMPSVSFTGQSVAFNIPFELSYGSFDELFEEFMCSTWTGNVLKNGVVSRSATYENKFVTDAGLRYDRVKGCMIDTFSLEVTPQQKLTGSFGLVGQKAESASAAIANSTYAEPPTTDIQTSNSVSITLSGIGSLAVSSISLAGANGLRQRPTVGSAYTDGLGLGRFEASGKLTTYFKNSALWDAYLAAIDAGTYFGLTITFNDPVAGSYSVFYPKVKLMNGAKSGGGNNADVMASFDFQAVGESTAGCAMQITRTPVAP